MGQAYYVAVRPPRTLSPNLGLICAGSNDYSAGTTAGSGATTPAASGNVYNVTRGEGRSLKELTDIIKRHLPDTTIQHREAPKYMPFRGTLSIAKARKELGYAPRISLDDGVRLYIEHLRNHPY